MPLTSLPSTCRTRASAPGYPTSVYALVGVPRMRCRAPEAGGGGHLDAGQRAAGGARADGLRPVDGHDTGGFGQAIGLVDRNAGGPQHGDPAVGQAVAAGEGETQPATQALAHHFPDETV